jgi:hypothetical protein
MTETARRTKIRNSQMQSRSCIQKLAWWKLGPIKNHFWPVRASSCWIGSTSFLNTHSPIFFTHDYTAIKFLSDSLDSIPPFFHHLTFISKNHIHIYIHIQSTATTLTRHNLQVICNDVIPFSYPRTSFSLIRKHIALIISRIALHRRPCLWLRNQPLAPSSPASMSIRKIHRHRPFAPLDLADQRMRSCKCHRAPSHSL